MTGFRDRLRFDPNRGEYRDGDIRYMMLRADALMGLFAELPEAQRLPAMMALGRSIRTFGGRSVAAYQAMGAVDAAAMLDTIASTAPQLGWGIWHFRREAGAILLHVRNSPFAAGAGQSPHPVCHAICGMLTAMGPVILGGAVRATETRCAARDGGEDCEFRIVREDEIAACGDGKN